MDWVWSNFGNATNLVSLSHQFAEWMRYENDLNDPKKPRSYPMILEDFFTPNSIELFSEILDEDGIQIGRSIYRNSLSMWEIIAE